MEELLEQADVDERYKGDGRLVYILNDSIHGSHEDRRFRPHQFMFLDLQTMLFLNGNKLEFELFSVHL